MKITKTALLLVLLNFSLVCFAQIEQNTETGIWAKEFSKEISLYKAKSYLITNVFGTDNNLVSFNIDPLAATSSGELTTLIYSCDDKDKSGLLLGFYGNYWNNSGTVYQGYAFKNLSEQKTFEMFKLLDEKIQENTSFLIADNDNNNIYFKYDDLTFLIYYTTNLKVRVLWNGFDSEWQESAYNRTNKRFKKKLKK